MGIIFLIVLVIVGVLYFDLRTRVTNIEQRFQGRKTKTSFLTHEEESLHEDPEVVSESAESKRTERVSLDGKTLDEKCLEWLKEDWMVKLGSFLVLLGFGWFVTYAFSHGWIEPSVRILFEVLIGVLVLLFGWWRMRVSKHRGSIFTLLGGTMVLLSLFAAQGVYDLFGPMFILTAMALTAGFVAFVGVHFKVGWLSFAGLIFAGIAPLLISVPEPNFIGLFSYLLVVIGGVLGVTYHSGSRGLAGLGLIIVSFYSLAGMASEMADVLLYFAYIFTAIFFATSLFEVLKQKKKNILPDLLTAGGTGLFVLVWVLVAGAETTQSLTLLIWMVAFFLGAFFTYETSRREEALYTYGAVATAFLFVVTMLEMSGSAFVVALIAEAALLVLASHAVTHDRKVTNNVSVVFLIPTLFMFLEFSRYMISGDGIFSSQFFSAIFFVLVTLAMGVVLRLKGKKRRSKEDKNVERSFFLLSAVSAYALYWVFFAKFLESYASLTILVTLLNVVTIFGVHYGVRKIRVTRQVTILLAIPFLMSLSQFAAYESSLGGIVGAFDEHFFTLLFYAMVLLGFGFFFRFAKGKREEESAQLSNGLVIVSSFYGLAIIWMLFHEILSNDDVAVMLTLANFTIFGIAAYFIGLFEEKRILRTCGAALLLFVALRLLLIDVWEMEIAVRIVTFLFVGVLLVGTAFFTKREKTS